MFFYSHIYTSHTHTYVSKSWRKRTSRLLFNSVGTPLMSVMLCAAFCFINKVKWHIIYTTNAPNRIELHVLLHIDKWVMMSTHTQIASAATLYYKLNEYKVVGLFFMFEIYAWVEYKKKTNILFPFYVRINMHSRKIYVEFIHQLKIKPKQVFKSRCIFFDIYLHIKLQTIYSI